MISLAATKLVQLHVVRFMFGCNLPDVRYLCFKMSCWEESLNVWYNYMYSQIHVWCIYWMFDISVSRCCAEKSPWGFGTITCTVRFIFGVSTRYSISLFRDVTLRRVLECLVQLHVVRFMFGCNLLDVRYLCFEMSRWEESLNVWYRLVAAN